MWRSAGWGAITAVVSFNKKPPRFGRRLEVHGMLGANLAPGP